MSSLGSVIISFILLKTTVSSTVLPDNGNTTVNELKDSSTANLSNRTLNLQTITQNPLVIPLDYDEIQTDGFVLTTVASLDAETTSPTEKTKGKGKNRQKNKQRNRNGKVGKDKDRAKSSTELLPTVSSTDVLIVNVTEEILPSTTVIINASLMTEITEAPRIFSTLDPIINSTNSSSISPSSSPEDNISAGHYILTFLTTSFVFGIIGYVSYFLYQRHQTRQLRLQLMPIYNYDPQESEDWENQLLDEEQNLRQPKEKIQLYSVLRE